MTIILEKKQNGRRHYEIVPADSICSAARMVEAQIGDALFVDTRDLVWDDERLRTSFDEIRMHAAYCLLDVQEKDANNGIPGLYWVRLDPEYFDDCRQYGRYRLYTIKGSEQIPAHRAGSTTIPDAPIQ